MLNKNQILKAEDLKKEKVNVPEWGGEIYVRTMTGTERDSFEQEIVNTDESANLKNIRARLCVLTIIDDKGNRLFDANDIEALGRKSALVLDRIFQVAQRLNGITSEDVEELAKNSENDQGDSSITD